MTIWTLMGSAHASAEIIQMEVEGIRNYSHYAGDQTFAGSKVGFGGATQPEAMAWLREQGFASVISLRAAAEEGAEIEASRKAAAAAGLEYIHLPFNPEDPAPELQRQFLAAAGDAVNQPVYIHCGSGTRAAMYWMMGRVRVDGLDTVEAEREGRFIAEKPDAAVEYFSTRLVGPGT